MYLKSIIYLYIHNISIYIYTYICQLPKLIININKHPAGQATFFGKPAYRPLRIVPQDLVTFAPLPFRLERGEQRRWFRRSFTPSLGEVHWGAVVPMGTLGILGFFAITRWWLFVSHPSEKYCIIKLDHFPKFSGWKLQKYVKQPPPG